MEAVATRAGVGKATIYRRWPGKEDLLLDAIGALQNPLPEPAGESVREDLVTILGAMRDSVADPRRAREFALLLGEGAKYPRLMARYVETMLEPRREVIRSVLRRARKYGWKVFVHAQGRAVANCFSDPARLVRLNEVLGAADAVLPISRHLAHLVRKTTEPLLWRVQVRRGLVAFKGKDVPVTAIVGVEFKASDVKNLE